MTAQSTFLDPSASFRDQLLIRTEAAILMRGHMVISVGNGRCLDPTCPAEHSPMPWAYSIGFAARGHPEIVTFGLQDRCISFLIDWLFRRLDTGDPLPVGEVANVDGHLIKLAEVPVEWLEHDPQRMAGWIDHYAAGRTSLSLPDVLQLLWAGADGRFPDEDDCDPRVLQHQPVLAHDPYSAPPPTSREHRRRRRRR